MKDTKQTSYLTDDANRYYAFGASANSLAGLRNPFFTSAQALIRSVFFMPNCLWWAVWRRFGAPHLVSGIANSVQSATLYRFATMVVTFNYTRSKPCLNLFIRLPAKPVPK